MSKTYCLTKMLWQQSNTGALQAADSSYMVVVKVSEPKNRKCLNEKTSPTCVMALAIAMLKLLLGLAALVPGLGGRAAVVLGLRQQRGNGLPQRFGLGMECRVVLVLDVVWSFLLLPVLRWHLVGSRGWYLCLIGGLVSSLGLRLWWMLGV